MRKWFVGLMMLLALMPPTAMALGGEWCNVCQARQDFVETNEYLAVPTADEHIRNYECTVCGAINAMGKSYPHEKSKPATCVSGTYCALCKTYFGDKDPNAHVGSCWTTYKKTSETQHALHALYDCCGKLVQGTPEAHTPSTAATCTTAAYCADCDSNYGSTDPNAHNLVQHDAQAPTCTAIGWNAYETCSRCDYTTYAEKSALGHDYAAKTTKPTCTEMGYTTHTCTRCGESYRDAIVSALGHWYGEWTPNADGTNSASCLRDAYEHTVDCARFSFVLTAEDVRTEFVLCPVCGEVSDGTRLMLAEAAAKAVTGKLPAGEIVVRMGALESGEQLMSVAFERGGKPTQPTGQVKITLLAEVLEGYALCLLSEDGAETELTLEGDEEEETISFTLDFTNSETPVQVIRLIPEV